MTDMNQSLDMPQDIKPSLPPGIKVLTILTFIGCGVLAIWTLCMGALTRFGMRMMDKAINEGNLPEDKINEMMKQRPKLELFMNNIIPLTIIGLVGIGLCFYGALRMRKLKKEGFYVYVLGQVLPFIGTSVLIGFSAQFSGVASYIFAAIPLVFIILYAAQLKHMK